MNTTEHPQTKTPVKKPYAKPAIVYQEPLEAMAAGCLGGKTPSDPPGPCSGNNFS